MVSKDLFKQIRPCHTAAILSRETKKALFYHAKPHPHGFHCEARDNMAAVCQGRIGSFPRPTVWPFFQSKYKRGKFMEIKKRQLMKGMGGSLKRVANGTI